MARFRDDLNIQKSWQVQRPEVTPSYTPQRFPKVQAQAVQQPAPQPQPQTWQKFGQGAVNFGKGALNLGKNIAYNMAKDVTAGAEAIGRGHPGAIIGDRTVAGMKGLYGGFKRPEGVDFRTAYDKAKYQHLARPLMYEKLFKKDVSKPEDARSFVAGAMRSPTYAYAPSKGALSQTGNLAQRLLSRTGSILPEATINTGLMQFEQGNMDNAGKNFLTNVALMSLLSNAGGEFSRFRNAANVPPAPAPQTPQNVVGRVASGADDSNLSRTYGKLRTTGRGITSEVTGTPATLFDDPIYNVNFRGQDLKHKIPVRNTDYVPSKNGVKPPKIDFDGVKDQGAWFLSRDTMERNIDKVFGKQAPQIKSFLSDTVKKNETARSSWLTDTRTKINKDVVEGMGIKVGSADDKLVQQLGEGRISIDAVKQKSPKNWQNIVKASEYFRSLYDDFLDQINAVRAQYNYQPIPKRQDYFRHFQEVGSVIDEYGVLLKETDLPTEIAGKTDIFKPYKPFSTTELMRKGGEFTDSAIGGMDNYLDSISKQMFHMDSVQRGRALENYIRLAGEQGKVKAPNFVANLDEYTNLLAGKKSRLDRGFEHTFGRKVYNVMNFLRGKTGANMVGGNVSSATANFVPLTQSLATTNKKSAMKGLTEALESPLRADDYTQVAGMKSGFLTRRFPRKAIDFNTRGKVREMFGWLFESVDRFSAKTIVSGKFFEKLDEGLSPQSAMKYADDYAAKVMADRSIGQLPNLMNTRSLGWMTQFQTEINNQLSFMARDIPEFAGKNLAKEASMYAQFFIYAYIFNTMSEKVLGRRMQIDPIDWAMTTLGMNEKGESREPIDRMKYVANEALGQLPFTSTLTGGRWPISEAIPNPMAVINGESNWKKELINPLFYLVPPFGGGQLRKTLEGHKAYDRGFSETPSGRVRYVMDKDWKNALKSNVFGQYAVPEGREYFDRDYRPLGEADSEILKSLPREKQKEYYDSIREEQELMKKVNELKELDEVTKEDMAQFKSEEIQRLINIPEFSNLPIDVQRMVLEKYMSEINSAYNKKHKLDNINNYADVLNDIIKEHGYKPYLPL